VVVQVQQPRIDKSAGLDPRGVVEPGRGCVAARRDTLEDPGVVDVENPVGYLGPLVVEGHEVTGDRERGRQKWR
jgi:hypothetical protein